MQNKVPLAASVLLAAASALPAQAGYELPWFTIDGGGQMWSAAGGWELGATVGQHDAGPAMSGGGWELLGGFWTVAAVATVLTGDLNCDGAVDFSDINAFVLALSDPAAYHAAYPACEILAGDCDSDGDVDFDDINPFIAILSGG